MPTILLVEDDPDVARILLHVLFDEGYSVDSVGTAAEAYMRLSENAYALVITDLRLPDGNGADVADNAAELGAETAIISGYVHQLTPDTADRHEVMAKPMRPVELITTVRRLIGRRDAQPATTALALR
jgi:DNA-binding response OmpR family regulator